ncbi:TSC22 domain family protein 2 isoform X2 [Latimeria chalumnae]|uniref:TSC22 domain family protein 2 isoform X2 n=1 Tax=Latimeria chalumnae TaxID=7897 RepID=UPI0003C1A4C5|nr:PREDICTED: TSC22 domain family protein 2 isoform X2 [Latimeria chalumnae]|eukprot:XP_006000961.1 PREDICTED: TSC22 domain family protein 2 isoform X2 [Latimeria chalumnae]
MSKMPAKKKSCFQITSVTTAQVAASSITDDTESLDDPDESRTEDVSSEIFDVSRATDYGPEEVCERSSSEETLNNVGEVETPGAVTPNVPQEGQLAAGSGPPNGGVAPRSTIMTALSGVSNVQSQALGTMGVAIQPPASTVAGGIQPPSSAVTVSATGTTSQQSATTATCGSRFRVIKLDHGTGEPYKRGRWTCMDYYDRDSENTMITRTVDSIRHISTLDHSTERDSGLGATGGSVVGPAVHSAHASESIADSTLVTASQLQQTDKTGQPSQQQPNFAIGHQPIGGAISQSTAQQIYPTAVGSQQQKMVQQSTQSQVNAQGGATQSVTQSGHSGKNLQSQNVPVVQPNVSLPPQQQQQVQQTIPVTQPQFAYPQSQIPPAHLLPNKPPVPSGQTDYMQHMAVMQPQGAIQQSAVGSVLPNPVNPSLPVGQVSSQGPSPIIPPTSVGAQGSEAVGQVSGVMQGAQTVPTQSVMQQQGGGSGGVVQQQPMNLQQATNLQPSSKASGVPSGPHAVVSGVQNVPAAVPSTAVSSIPGSVSASLVTMPNVPATMTQTQLSSQTAISRSNSISHPVGASVMQGLTVVPTSLQQSTVSPFQAQSQSGVGQLDEGRRKSEPLPQLPASVVAESKLPLKPFIPDTIGTPLHLPVATPVNSLANSVFTIPIALDGDEDSASGSSVVAIDNKIEQAMDLVKSHLMYAVREEVEVLKEQIKELIERNSMLERENALLKSLANNDQLAQLPTQSANPSSTSQQTVATQPSQQTQLPQQPNVSSA